MSLSAWWGDAGSRPERERCGEGEGTYSSEALWQWLQYGSFLVRGYAGTLGRGLTLGYRRTPAFRTT
jgi:hypothetical protein